MANLTIGVVGMGLIGGSLVKAIKKNTKHKVYGFDISEQTVKSALQEKSIDKELTNENLKECDYVFIPLYPEAVKEYFKSSKIIPKILSKKVVNEWLRRNPIC